MRILLVEDEPDLGAVIKQTLNREAYVVDWITDGTEAWWYLTNQEVEYTLAILDWLLPGLSGLELCRRLRKNNNPMPVLILTAKDKMEDKVAGLDAGADDYLVKPFGNEELLARLRALQRRSPKFQPQPLQVGNLLLDYSTRTVTLNNSSGVAPAISLTAKEFQLLEYLMQHPNQIVSRHQIRNHLWELDTEPISNVVAAQMRLLRQKLASLDCDSMIETVQGMGYRLNPAHVSRKTV